MARPLRDLFEKTTDKLPEGPLGFFGRGNAVGATNYFTVALINGIIPIDGIRIGFDVESHSVERDDDTEIHTFIINSYNKDVARFIAKFQSAPSNVDFFSQETEVLSINPVKERSTVTTWKAIVEVKERDEVRSG